MKTRITLTLGMLSAILCGCNSTPSLGDHMGARGDLAKQIGDQWNDGDKFVKKGKKLQEQAQKLSEEAAEKAAKSKELIERGQQMKAQSETTYKSQFPISNEQS